MLFAEQMLLMLGEAAGKSLHSTDGYSRLIQLGSGLCNLVLWKEMKRF